MFEDNELCEISADILCPGKEMSIRIPVDPNVLLHSLHQCHPLTPQPPSLQHGSSMDACPAGSEVSFIPFCVGVDVVLQQKHVLLFQTEKRPQGALTL